MRPAVLGPAHVTELVDVGQRISEGISCGSSVFRLAFNQRLDALGCTFRFGTRDCRRFLRQMNLKWRKPAGEKRKWPDSDVREHRELTARKLVWTLYDADAQPTRLCNIDETATKLLPIGEKEWPETLTELRRRLPHVRHKPHATVRHQLHACSEGWPHPLSCQPLGLFTFHETRRSHCFEAFVHGVETHFLGLAAHNLVGDIDRSSQRRSLETHLAVRRGVGLSTRSGTNTSCQWQPVHSRPAPEMLHVGSAEHDVDMGPGLIEEDGDVVDEDPDEEQLADAPFSVDELEDSRAGDDLSEAATVDAEPLPSPSAPADPVQILTHLQALRIVYGKCAPKWRPAL